MRARHTIVISDGRGNRPLRISLRGTLWFGFFVTVVPLLIGLGAKWSARSEIDRLRVAKAELEVENGSYRAVTGELTTQIQSLEAVINDLGVRAQVGPEQLRAMQKLPAVVRTRAAGGTNLPNTALSVLAKAPISSPEDTFGVLRDL